LLAVAAAVAYTAAYRLLWIPSLDQWFLPAGLRVAALLLSPVRFWGYVFFADAVALLQLRLPMADKYGVLWSCISPLLFSPLLALPIAVLKRRLGHRVRDLMLLPLIMAGLSFWMVAVQFGLNAALDGPITPVRDMPWDGLLFAMGYYLGMLTIVPVAVLVTTPKPAVPWPRHFVRDGVLALATTIAAFWIASPDNPGDASQRLLASMTILFLPALLMTLRHGWRGAATGIASMAVATKVSGHWANIPGHFDNALFPTDQAIAVVGTILLLLGARIGRQYLELRNKGLGERKATELAQTSFGWAERNLRQRLLSLAQTQLRLDDYRKAMVQRLRAHGHAAAAMDLNAAGFELADIFDQNAAALYPMQIEDQGLHAALHARAFSELWAPDTELMCLLRGDPRALSVRLQLAAYRCICNTFTLFSGSSPTVYEVRTRTVVGPHRQGIVIRILARGARPLVGDESQVQAELELQARSRAFGGRIKRRGHDAVTILLAEARTAVMDPPVSSGERVAS
jgi:glucose-6-phosphate-specific signal transduction histidine kinase